MDMSINKIGQRLVMILEKIIFLFEEDKPIHQVEEYGFLKIIEENFSKIKNELLDYDSTLFKNIEDLSEEQQSIVEKEKWKVLFLKVYGKEIEKNCQKFPVSTQLMKHRSIKTAMFSVLQPQTLISPHRGPYKGVLRYHLGILIPHEYEKCAIRIDKKEFYWQEGKSLIFDDTFEHEAWNNSQERRVILFLDIEREFKFPFNILNKSILWIISHSPFVNNIYEKSQTETC